MKKGLILAAIIGVVFLVATYALFQNFSNKDTVDYKEKNITLLIPNGKEIWTKGSTQVIKWTSKNLGNDKIAIHIRRIPPPPLREEGQEFDPIIVTDLQNSGSMEWLISDMYPPGNYLIEVVAYPSKPIKDFVSDESDSYFQIVSSNNIVGGDKDKHDCIGSAGYSWCEAKQKCFRPFEELCQDEVSTLIDRIKSSSGVSLAYSGTTTFDWNVSDHQVWKNLKIDGIKYYGDKIKMFDYERVEKYLNDQYGMDVFNVADGVKGGLRGYYINYMACALNFEHAQLKTFPNSPSVPVGDSLKVWLNCGYFNKNNISKILNSKI
jgi:hypothetical protein